MVWVGLSVHKPLEEDGYDEVEVIAAIRVEIDDAACCK